MTQSQVRSNALHKSISGILHAGVLATALALSVPAWAQSAAAIHFDIPAQPLSTALKAFAEQSGMQLLYQSKAVGNVTARPIQGNLDRRQALQQLLEGTGLEVVYSGENAATIRPRIVPQAEAQKKSTSVDEAATRSDGEADGNAPASPTGNRSAASTIDTIVVTGTRIRGGAIPSPVISLGSERIVEEGFGNLGEVIRSIPQNFRGGQNPGVVNGAASSLANQNLTGGSSLNLRGLGPDATLTLLNGRRLSYSGFAQAVDISAIPVEAVDRFEIVPDGASAIYGSDAVGGVGNVILKREFDGLAVGIRHGDTSDGGLGTNEYTVTAGAAWSTGGLIATYKDVSADPIFADQRDYTRNMYNPYTLYPENDLRSGLLSAYQALGDTGELRLDALRTKREVVSYQGFPGFHAIAEPEASTYLVSPGIDVFLPNDWTFSIGGTWGKDETYYRTSVIRPAGVSSSGTHYGNRSRAYEMGAEGPVFVLPGGEARIAVGIGYRSNTFVQHSLVTGVSSADADQNSRFAYAEINLPLIGPDQAVPGVRRLEASVAVRGEDYDSFDGVTTPKLGLIYGPGDDFTLKASWGKSFKAPTLLQLGQLRSAYLYRAADFGGAGYPEDATVLMPYGGNPGLDPERAETWSASLAFHPGALPGLEAELTWFHIDYRDRVVQPIPNYTQALGNPEFDEFIDYAPTPALLAAIVGTSPVFYNNSGAAYDPDKVVAVADNRYTNAARQRIEGLDLSGSYGVDLGTGRLTIRGSASWLDSWQQTSANQGVFDLAGILFNPSRHAARLGAVWRHGGFSASTFANYTSGVTNTLDDEESASFTTFDVSIRHAIGDRDDVWSGFAFELAAQNLLDRAPPLYSPASATTFRYDSTNYSAIGRYLSVAISKRW